VFITVAGAGSLATACWSPLNIRTLQRHIVGVDNFIDQLSNADRYADATKNYFELEQVNFQQNAIFLAAA
jgi:hypothetical protein